MIKLRRSNERKERVILVRAETRKYNLPKHRYYELQHMCYQYQDWKRELQQLMPLGRSSECEDGSRGIGKPTENLAIKRATLEKRCTLIEQAAEEAGELFFVDGAVDISRYILQSVTDETFSYNYKADEIPCGKNKFYECRRKFFYLLSAKC